MNTTNTSGKIFFVRHGQTNNNLKNNMNTGDDNDPLTEKGIAQAIEAGKKLADSLIRIDLIISSHLDRAVDTGKLIAEQISYSGEFLIDKRLREQDGGSLKGANRAELCKMHNFESNYEFRKFFRDEKNNDIESAEEFDQRVSAAYNDIQEKYGSKNVLIVAHSGTSRPLLRNAQNLDFDFAIYEMDGLENAKVIDLHNYKI